MQDPKRVNSETYYKHVARQPEEYQLLCANCNWIKRSEQKNEGPAVIEDALPFAEIIEKLQARQRLRNASAAEAGFPNGLEEDDREFDRLVKEYS